MTDDRDRVSSDRAILIGRERSTRRHRHSEQSEEVPGDGSSMDRTSVVAGTNLEIRYAEECPSTGEAGDPTDGQIVRVGTRAARGRLNHPRVPYDVEADQVLWVRHPPRLTQEQRMHHSENRRGGTDSDSQHGHCDEGRARRPSQGAERVVEVPGEVR